MGYFVPLLFLAVVAATSAETVPLILAPVEVVPQQAHIAEVETPVAVIRPKRDPQFGGAGSSASAQSASFGFGPFQGSFSSSQASSQAVGGGFGGPGFGGPGFGGPGFGGPGFGHGGYGGGYGGHRGGYHGGHGGYHGGYGGHRRRPGYGHYGRRGFF
ncbi:keratin, type I cytoskeletal 10-like [Ischnura elegans]|uniref:keratin, type I cytoskeletal 10-like n=1 Tax=Ischnura elegans TaxID=197161 RepID=UPI001ED87702|nr:keratin, type I cytoskeletal 10-like [Ischnura elegans]